MQSICAPTVIVSSMLGFTSTSSLLWVDASGSILHFCLPTFTSLKWPGIQGQNSFSINQHFFPSSSASRGKLESTISMELTLLWALRIVMTNIFQPFKEYIIRLDAWFSWNFWVYKSLWNEQKMNQIVCPKKCWCWDSFSLQLIARCLLWWPLS